MKPYTILSLVFVFILVANAQPPEPSTLGYSTIDNSDPGVQAAFEAASKQWKDIRIAGLPVTNITLQESYFKEAPDGTYYILKMIGEDSNKKYLANVEFKVFSPTNGKPGALTMTNLSRPDVPILFWAAEGIPAGYSPINTTEDNKVAAAFNAAVDTLWIYKPEVPTDFFKSFVLLNASSRESNGTYYQIYIEAKNKTGTFVYVANVRTLENGDVKVNTITTAGVKPLDHNVFYPRYECCGAVTIGFNYWGPLNPFEPYKMELSNLTFDAAATQLKQRQSDIESVSKRSVSVGFEDILIRPGIEDETRQQTPIVDRKHYVRVLLDVQFQNGTNATYGVLHTFKSDGLSPKPNNFTEPTLVELSPVEIKPPKVKVQEPNVPPPPPSNNGTITTPTEEPTNTNNTSPPSSSAAICSPSYVLILLCAVHTLWSVTPTQPLKMQPSAVIFIILAFSAFSNAQQAAIEFSFEGYSPVDKNDPGVQAAFEAAKEKWLEYGNFGDPLSNITLQSGDFKNVSDGSGTSYMLVLAGYASPSLATSPTYPVTTNATVFAPTNGQPEVMYMSSVRGPAFKLFYVAEGTPPGYSSINIQGKGVVDAFNAAVDKLWIYKPDGKTDFFKTFVLLNASSRESGGTYYQMYIEAKNNTSAFVYVANVRTSENGEVKVNTITTAGGGNQEVIFPKWYCCGALTPTFNGWNPGGGGESSPEAVELSKLASDIAATQGDIINVSIRSIGTGIESFLKPSPTEDIRYTRILMDVEFKNGTQATYGAMHIFNAFEVPIKYAVSDVTELSPVEISLSKQAVPNVPPPPASDNSTITTPTELINTNNTSPPQSSAVITSPSYVLILLCAVHTLWSVTPSQTLKVKPYTIISLVVVFILVVNGQPQPEIISTSGYSQIDNGDPGVKAAFEVASKQWKEIQIDGLPVTNITLIQTYFKDAPDGTFYILRMIGEDSSKPGSGKVELDIKLFSPTDGKPEVLTMTDFGVPEAPYLAWAAEGIPAGYSSINTTEDNKVAAAFNAAVDTLWIYKPDGPTDFFKSFVLLNASSRESNGTYYQMYIEAKNKTSAFVYIANAVGMGNGNDIEVNSITTAGGVNPVYNNVVYPKYECCGSLAIGFNGWGPFIPYKPFNTEFSNVALAFDAAATQLKQQQSDVENVSQRSIASGFEYTINRNQSLAPPPAQKHYVRVLMDVKFTNGTIVTYGALHTSKANGYPPEIISEPTLVELSPVEIKPAKLKAQEPTVPPPPTSGNNNTTETPTAEPSITNNNTNVPPKSSAFFHCPCFILYFTMYILFVV